MNRSFAGWLADNPRGAVFVAALLGLLPPFGLGFVFFVPGAVPALLALQKGPRAGAAVALGAAVLLAVAMWSIWRPDPAALVYVPWLLAPPLLLAGVLLRSRSLSFCIQVATLAGGALVAVLHLAFGEPTTESWPFAQYLGPMMRELAQQLQRYELLKPEEVETFVGAVAGMMWGMIALSTAMTATCAVLLARWWQSLIAQAGSFGSEFRQLRLGRVLGTLTALAIVVSLWLRVAWINDMARLLESAFLLVGLAALHRFRVDRGLNVAWLWVTYLGLFLVPIMAPAVAGWGFVDNWVRSGRRDAAI